MLAWSYMILYDPIWSYMILYDPIWSYMILYDPICSYMILYVKLRLIVYICLGVLCISNYFHASILLPSSLHNESMTIFTCSSEVYPCLVILVPWKRAIGIWAIVAMMATVGVFWSLLILTIWFFATTVLGWFSWLTRLRWLLRLSSASFVP